MAHDGPCVLERQKQGPHPSRPPSEAVGAPPGRRIALVIGNSAYQAAGRLVNPANDARAVAASFRRLGFAEVIERYDLDLTSMSTAIKYFGDRSTAADWAVVYYSGHGLEMNGIAYLIPVDARLERDTHVSDETVALSRVLDKVESARKLRLVILDACRNNPFVARMIRSAGVTRSIGRGHAPIEPEGGVLVAYAAKHGTTAEDGTGTNSPFAEALLANLEEPGLEINFCFEEFVTKCSPVPTGGKNLSFTVCCRARACSSGRPRHAEIDATFASLEDGGRERVQSISGTPWKPPRPTACRPPPSISTWPPSASRRLGSVTSKDEGGAGSTITPRCRSRFMDS